MKRLRKHIARLRGCDAGAPVVEFAIVLPLILIFIAVIIEGGRISWIYQSAAAGVRDASRMVARIAPVDLCPSGSITSYDAMVTDIVENRLNGSSVIPGGATVLDVIPVLHTRTGAYRIDPTCVVEVRAQVQIDYIFGGVFGWFGNPLGPVVTEVADQSRIFGV